MAFWDSLVRWFAKDTPAPTAAYDEPVAVATIEKEAAPQPIQDDGPTDGWWTPQGSPVAEQLPPAAHQTPVNDDLHRLIMAVLRDPDLDLPKLPQVASQALSMLGGASCNFRQLSDIISRDPALSAAVLRMANSVAYRGIKEIVQLEPAFVRIGVRGVRAMLLTASVKGLAIRVDGQKTLAQEVWRRSVASGVILSSLAPRFKLPEDDAFLVGLLHDIGDLALVRVIHDRQQSQERKMTRSVFEALSAQWHEHLGLRLADAWNLPDPLPQLIGQHHGVALENEPERTYQWLIRLSDAAVSMMKYSPYVPYDFFNLMCVRELGLQNDSQTRAMLAEWPGKIDDRLASF